MGECVKCLRGEDSCRLVDAIYENEIVKICEECALKEDFPIIRRPSSFQLKESEKPYSVYQRLARMAGVKVNRVEQNEKKHETSSGITLDKLRKAKDYSQTYKEKQVLATKANKPLDLVDNFNWHIQMTRRDKKMTIGQLADSIGEAESTLKLIEQGNLVDDSDRIIGKIEQFFKIKLRKSEVEKEQARLESVQKPIRILNFDKNSMNNISISDLRRMKETREAQTEEEKDREIASKLVWQGARKTEAKGGQAEEKIADEDIEIIEE